jgi:hypothetical protein
MGWLATLVGGAYYAASGPKKPASAAAAPPINASSSDEADFIKCVIYFVDDLDENPTNGLTGNSLRSRIRRTKLQNLKTGVAGWQCIVYCT